LDFRPSEYAEENCTDKNKNRANHHDVDLQGYVHEGASLIVDDEASLPENRESSRPTDLALRQRLPDASLILGQRLVPKAIILSHHRHLAGTGFARAP
jgi:hypothetical protein